MPPRSKVLALPQDVRAELDQELVRRGFQGYDALVAWLAERGHGISRSAVHRYGQEFEERVRMLQLASQQAQAIVEALGDDAGAMGEALTAVAQEKAFQVLMELNVEDASDVAFDKLLAGVARLNTAGVAQKKFRQEVRRRAEAAAAEVDTIVRRGGLSDDAAAQIRAQILGVAPSA